MFRLILITILMIFIALSTFFLNIVIFDAEYFDNPFSYLLIFLGIIILCNVPYIGNKKLIQGDELQYCIIMSIIRSMVGIILLGFNYYSVTYIADLIFSAGVGYIYTKRSLIFKSGNN